MSTRVELEVRCYAMKRYSDHDGLIEPWEEPDYWNVYTVSTSYDEHDDVLDTEFGDFDKDFDTREEAELVATFLAGVLGCDVEYHPN